MCTSIRYKNYFGRNLDIWTDYGESVIITPRGYLGNSFAIVGMGIERDEYPLYFDGMNEKGLGMAGLNFPGYARYFPERGGKKNIAPYEFIPYILGRCGDLCDVRSELEGINISDIHFSPEMPNTPLHWMIADSSGSVVVESCDSGLKVYDDPADVLTNSPGFDIQSFNLENYKHLSPLAKFQSYSNGMGALGLPGDCSSMSRFVRSAYFVGNSPTIEGKNAQIAHFFHLLSVVFMPQGSVLLHDGECEYTRYSCCCDLEDMKYYYRTYDALSVLSVDLLGSNLDSSKLIFPT